MTLFELQVYGSIGKMKLKDVLLEKFLSIPVCIQLTVVHGMVIHIKVFIIIIIDRFYIVLFSAFGQTHCARMFLWEIILLQSTVARCPFSRPLRI